MTTDWNKLALHYAAVANKNYYVRSDAYGAPPTSLHGEHVVLLNNLAAKNMPTLRDRQQAELSRRLEGFGITTLASATYPESGPNEGISAAMVFDAREDQCELIEDEWDYVYCTYGWDES